MKQYALLGTYNHRKRRNMEILTTSDDYQELRKMWASIIIINKELDGKKRDPSYPQVTGILETHLSAIDMVDKDTGLVYEVRVIGIFSLDEFVRVYCRSCKRLLFTGTKTYAELFIRYCPYCLRRVP